MCEFDQHVATASGLSQKAANAAPSVRILDEANANCKLIWIPESRMRSEAVNPVDLGRSSAPSFSVIFRGNF
jgi:hypothetical protein